MSARFPRLSVALGLRLRNSSLCWRQNLRITRGFYDVIPKDDPAYRRLRKFEDRLQAMDISPILSSFIALSSDESLSLESKNEHLFKCLMISCDRNQLDIALALWLLFGKELSPQNKTEFLNAILKAIRIESDGWWLKDIIGVLNSKNSKQNVESEYQEKEAVVTSIDLCLASLRKKNYAEAEYYLSQSFDGGNTTLTHTQAIAQLILFAWRQKWTEVSCLLDFYKSSVKNEQESSNTKSSLYPLIKRSQLLDDSVEFLLHWDEDLARSLAANVERRTNYKLDPLHKARLEMRDSLVKQVKRGMKNIFKV